MMSYQGLNLGLDVISEGAIVHGVDSVVRPCEQRIRDPGATGPLSGKDLSQSKLEENRRDETKVRRALIML